jgi:hypothetical protein
MAMLLGVNRKTIVRKLIFLGEQAMLSQQRYLSERLKTEDWRQGERVPL